ncbi:hypothetical protein E2C01_068645 [Portunus trituberculatus]|uniref:Uncharacterized protein n=1 Tax=Portunus trituberculatus TaxID=210409 RepID=A0A5B7I011_PORTR|nr:hypothetical protein [Portunus trituberculatus]
MDKINTLSTSTGNLLRRTLVKQQTRVHKCVQAGRMSNSPCLTTECLDVLHHTTKEADLVPGVLVMMMMMMIMMVMVMMMMTC